MSVLKLLKHLYFRLPLSPAMRHRLGLLKRKLVARPGNPGRSSTADVDAPRLERATMDQSSGIRLQMVAQSRAQVEGADLQTADETLGLGLGEETVAVFFSVIDWHFRHQRPQQLALSLARRGIPVFYISVNFVDDAKAGFRFERLHPELQLYQIFLHVRGAHSVYSDVSDGEILRQQKLGQRMMWEQFLIRDAIHIVQHPYWTALASSVSASKLVYDCMDFHAGFSNTSQAHHLGEQALIGQADLTIVSSDYLFGMASEAGAKALTVIRNATEYAHFHKAYNPSQPHPKPVIGYYGAIAEWFDVDLVRSLALAFPQVEIRLIGADTVNAQAQLKEFSHVRFLGEHPYSGLPDQLAAFSVCIIPFRIIELTLATNPVKVYEYLSSGKPVVAVDLPELRSMDHLVARCSNTASFIASVGAALNENDPQKQQARMAFAAQQTWEHRASDLVLKLRDSSHEPLVSVVIVTYNNKRLTERCLKSLSDPKLQGAYAVPIELIVVDNASSDGSIEMLHAWNQLRPEPLAPLCSRKVILNLENRGFGPAVNQGLASAQGEYLVILNNDTIVTAGWARGLMRHLQRDPELGMVGPVTNNIGNESMIRLPDDSIKQTCLAARRYNLDHAGERYPLRIAAFFCVMMPRRIYDLVGGLDERFVPGFFEDDDYCLRIAQAGFKIACAEDVFVYHELSASFDQLAAAKRAAIFERNKALFEAKWGPWIPHQYRPVSADTNG